MAEVDLAIVGTRHHGKAALDALAHLEMGNPVRLERQPRNQHDPNAIAVYYAGIQIGWISKIANAHLAAAMDAGARPVAICHRPAIFRGRGGRFVDQEAMIRVAWQEPAAEAAK